MKTWHAVALALAALAAAAAAFAWADARHAFDGCRLDVASEASAPVHYEVQRGSTTRAGELAPGASASVRLCWLAPREDDAQARVATSHGNLTVALDPYCSQPRVVVNDSAARLDARTCE